MKSWEEYRVEVPEGQAGDWSIARFTVPDAPTIQNLRYAMHGMMTVPPGVYTRLMRKGDWEPMMSDTPAEIASHLGAIYKAKGRVLLNGLGLGMVLKAILAKPDVLSVDVVEIDPDVASLVWPTYAADPRAHLHIADALSITWPREQRWDVAWHDIWPNICSDNWPTMKQLQRRYASKTDWQDSWQRPWVRRLIRQGVGR